MLVTASPNSYCIARATLLVGSNFLFAVSSMVLLGGGGHDCASTYDVRLLGTFGQNTSALVRDVHQRRVHISNRLFWRVELGK